MACLRIDSATTVQTSGPDEQGPPKFYSVALKCGASPFRGSNGVTDAAVQAIFEAGTNNSAAYAPSLTGTFINRSEKHTYELQSIMRSTYALLCLKKKTSRQLH